MILSIDRSVAKLAAKLEELAVEKGIRQDMAIVDFKHETLPQIYAITDIFCTPSVLEGFSQSPMEAAATRVPVVASDRVPFAVDFLLGETVKEEPCEGGGILRVGEAAIVVPADDTNGLPRHWKSF